jgi:hypothetical protein
MMQWEEIEPNTVTGKDYAIAPLFNLSMDLFYISISLVPLKERTPLKEEKHRLVLWANNFEESLDLLFERKKDDRLASMVAMLLGRVILSLNEWLAECLAL